MVDSLNSSHLLPNTLLAATWNVAAINNNPFEYWVTYADDEYNDFMIDVENLLASENQDVPVNHIFTESMFLELIEEMKTQNLPNLDQLHKVWLDDYSKRKAIQEFLKDKTIGEKRLTSMPDRITNTINLINGDKLKRPSVINAYQVRPLSSIAIWWEEWRKFMFSTHIQIFRHDALESRSQLICSLIRPIHRDKYPAISAEEQVISVQLQLLCLAILDSIFIYIVNRVAPATWETIRQTLCHALIHRKDERICQILAESYLACDAIFLQEVSGALVRAVRAHPALNERFAVLVPDRFDARRDQNSVVLAARRRFAAALATDVTPLVLDQTRGGWGRKGRWRERERTEARGREGVGRGRIGSPPLASLHRQRYFPLLTHSHPSSPSLSLALPLSSCFPRSLHLPLSLLTSRGAKMKREQRLGEVDGSRPSAGWGGGRRVGGGWEEGVMVRRG
jgi:hypothetical protein